MKRHDYMTYSKRRLNHCRWTQPDTARIIALSCMVQACTQHACTHHDQHSAILHGFTCNSYLPCCGKSSYHSRPAYGQHFTTYWCSTSNQYVQHCRSVAAGNCQLDMIASWPLVNVPLQRVSETYAPLSTLSLSLPDSHLQR